jgi:chemotaxis protein methyltransferase CheR
MAQRSDDLDLNDDLNALLDKIRRERGFDGHQYKRSFLQRRLAVRMQARGATSYRAYQALLDQDPCEYRSLMSTLTINLSYFFRDGEVFLSIRDDLLAPLIARRAAKGRRHLTIWSAGCAGGEEPYSLAILLGELLGSELADWQLEILATDIDEETLGKARSGRFSEFSFRGVSEAFLAPYFIQEGKQHLIRPKFKQLVTFRHHDLLNHAPPAGPFDLVLCRNVLIYFTRQRQAQVFSTLFRALRPGGHLVLGKTEIPIASTVLLFEIAKPRLHIYVKSPTEKSA